ncbi:MAG TPA: site-specific DNA-methyltransferase [Dehalococcoidia bacterium]|nr:site-specific DNA-methyltransferase [Dehalococcoidia bacterium]
MRLAEVYSNDADVVLYHGDCLALLNQIPPSSVQLVVTSPPYNIGKSYEQKRILDEYLTEQAQVISRCVELLKDGGSICWEVGNHIVGSQEVLPLDIALYPIFASHDLKLRNRIIWHFEHGLHCSKRFSGRYETILWFTKGDRYVFNLDPVRVPQKYPGKKYFKGPKVGKYSSHPLGKNPGDLWIIPNVKHRHIEKTIHPCQFPVELVERLVLALTHEGDLVLDPYIGVGSTAVAALMHGRRAAGADIVGEYIEIAKQRVTLAAAGLLKTRPMNRPIYVPPKTSVLIRREGEVSPPSKKPGHTSSLNIQLPLGSSK